MYDPRIDELAQVLTGYSTRIRKGDVVQIVAIGEGTVPLVKALHKAALMRGAACVEYEFSFPDIDRDFFNLATKSQIEHFPRHKLNFMKKVDVFIAVRAAENSMVFANANQKNIAARSKVLRPILDWRVNRTRWVVTRFPCHGAAQDAKMSLEEFADFFFKATIADWAAVKKRQQKLVGLMNRARQVKVTAPGTELSFSIAGMKAINCCGERNIPDGEVYTAPVKNSVEGSITYNVPSVYQGKEFLGVRLEFEKGRIVKAECGDLTRDLNQVFDTDAGARYVGEFAIGTNYAISQPMRNILFDEKIGGSMHFTPGMAYEDADNGNRSAVHWDLVLDLRPGGRIEFDGKPILVDGRFVHRDLLDLNPPKPRRKAARRKR